MGRTTPISHFVRFPLPCILGRADSSDYSGIIEENKCNIISEKIPSFSVISKEYRLLIFLPDFLTYSKDELGVMKESIKQWRRTESRHMVPWQFRLKGAHIASFILLGTKIL